MAEWKKVIVSGSNADLAEVTASVGFIGDGSAITGIVEASLANDAVTNAKLANITRGSVKVGGASNAPTDLAAKTSGQILVGDGTDIVSVAVSGDVTLAANGAVTIANTAVETAMIADDAVDADKLAANAVVNASIASNAAIAHSKLAALASTKVLVGNGSNVATEVALSGDVTMDNAGAVTIANTSVTNAMIGDGAVDTEEIADDAVTAAKLASNAVVNASIASNAAIAHTKLAALAATKVLVGNGSNVATAVALSGDVTMNNAGAVTIANTAVETAMIADNAVDGDKLADSVTMADSLLAKNVTASLGISSSHFSASTDIIASGNIITTSGSFIGSGAELTGITVDIDGLSAVTTPHQTQDHFIISDNGTEKKITFSNV